jgi:hypothetical protein
MAFTPVTVRKDGRADRVANSPTELVQFEHDGWVAAKDEPKAPAPVPPRVPAAPSNPTPPQSPTSQ